MSKLRISGFTVSLDGYGAGLGQDEQNPLGRNVVEHVPSAAATHVVLACRK